MFNNNHNTTKGNAMQTKTLKVTDLQLVDDGTLDTVVRVVGMSDVLPDFRFEGSRCRNSIGQIDWDLLWENEGAYMQDRLDAEVQNHNQQEAKRDEKERRDAECGMQPRDESERCIVAGCGKETDGNRYHCPDCLAGEPVSKFGVELRKVNIVDIAKVMDAEQHKHTLDLNPLFQVLEGFRSIRGISTCGECGHRITSAQRALDTPNDEMVVAAEAYEKMRVFAANLETELHERTLERDEWKAKVEVMAEEVIDTFSGLPLDMGLGQDLDYAMDEVTDTGTEAVEAMGKLTTLLGDLLEVAQEASEKLDEAMDMHPVKVVMKEVDEMGDEVDEVAENLQALCDRFAREAK